MSKINIVDSVKSFELNFNIFPYQIKLMNNNGECIKKLSFNTKDEMTSTMDKIWREYGKRKNKK